MASKDYEVVYYSKNAEGVIISPSFGSFKSKEEFADKVAVYEKNYPEKKLYHFDETSDCFTIIKYFESLSPVARLKENLQDIRDYYNTAEDNLRNIECIMEKLEEEFLQKD